MVRVFYKQFKIFNPVIGFIAVDMMNNLFGFKIPPNMLFHDKTVFADVKSHNFMRMIRSVNQNIPIMNVFSAFPVGGFIGKFTSSIMRIFAKSRTEYFAFNITLATRNQLPAFQAVFVEYLSLIYPVFFTRKARKNKFIFENSAAAHGAENSLLGKARLNMKFTFAHFANYGHWFLVSWVTIARKFREFHSFIPSDPAIRVAFLRAKIFLRNITRFFHEFFIAMEAIKLNLCGNTSDSTIPRTIMDNIQMGWLDLEFIIANFALFNNWHKQTPFYKNLFYHNNLKPSTLAEEGY